ncbi:hypothetical protein TSAR_016688 [Trichomalopsis sarcophagae]|uniref:Alpha-(1,6)-fucosyltransferase N- and catalytic domain-containing protein n=1 Tax=Trichomalopsis sarcophagae TaxID=543379 RepID=A0A232F4U0_9HYME|nr:hypothetical protein TSAR_016688 [Trichomalopsis sarcophagae]
MLKNTCEYIKIFRYFINGELNKIKKSLDKYNTYNDLSATFNLVNEYKKSLITNIDKIYQIDGYTKWREKEANDLSSLVQQRFRYGICLHSNFFVSILVLNIFSTSLKGYCYVQTTPY